MLSLSSIYLALAIGAKIYPVVLLPLMTLRLLFNKQWLKAAAYLLATILLSFILLSPMLTTIPTVQVNAASPQSAETGLTAFIQHWEINDLFFMLVYENLKADSTTEHWFRVLPASWTTSMYEIWSYKLPNMQLDEFQLTRFILLVLYLLIISRYSYYLYKKTRLHYITFKTSRIDADHQWLNLLFLGMALFWVLSPTQNPWYWLWALPLVPYTKLKSWHFVSGALTLYYLRFYCSYHLDDTSHSLLGYKGEEIFHYVFVPLEHLLWLIPLLIEMIISRCPKSAKHKSAIPG
jgi:hypothetical protein